MIGWCCGGCTDESCILGGRVHRMKDPGICPTKRGFFWRSDRGPSSHGNTANGHNAPHNRSPNTLGLEENHILSWNTENGSCALGICDYCNEIGRNRWCTLVGLWPRTLERQERSEFLGLSPWTRHLGLAQWAWQNCTQHPAGTAASHPGSRHTRFRLLSPDTGHWEQKGVLLWDCNRCRQTDRCKNSNWHLRHQHCDLRPKVRDFPTESCQMTLVDVTHINQLMHHGPKSIIPFHLTIRRLLSMR